MNDENQETETTPAAKALPSSAGSQFYRLPTPSEWKDIVTTMTKKECEVFFYHRGKDCKVLKSVNPLNCWSDLGISKSAYNGRCRSIKKKAIRFLSANK